MILWQARILALVLALCFSGHALGVSHADINVYLDYDQSGQSSVKNTRWNQFLNLGYGLAISEQIFAGGKFYYHRESNSTAGSAGVVTTFSAVAPFIAYGSPTGDGLWLDLAVLLLPTINIKAETDMTMYGGNGFALGAGYLLKAGAWSIGPMIQYIHANYKKQKSGSAASELVETHVEGGLQQYIGFRYTL